MVSIIRSYLCVSRIDRVNSVAVHGDVLTLHVLRKGAGERAGHARHNRAGQQVHVADRLQAGPQTSRPEGNAKLCGLVGATQRTRWQRRESTTNSTFHGYNLVKKTVYGRGSSIPQRGVLSTSRHWASRPAPASALGRLHGTSEEKGGDRQCGSPWRGCRRAAT